MRLFLIVWLAAFAVQSTDLLAAVVPDECVEGVPGAAGDSCPENCARCVCCARLPVFVPQVQAPFATDVLITAIAIPLIDPSTSAVPRGIFHVPRTR